MFAERPAIKIPEQRSPEPMMVDKKLHLTGPVYGNGNLERFKTLFRKTYGRYPKGAELMAWA
jgi:hypothetical protein